MISIHEGALLNLHLQIHPLYLFIISEMALSGGNSFWTSYIAMGLIFWTKASSANFRWIFFWGCWHKQVALKGRVVAHPGIDLNSRVKIQGMSLCGEQVVQVCQPYLCKIRAFLIAGSFSWNSSYLVVRKHLTLIVSPPGSWGSDTRARSLLRPVL